MAVKEGKVSKPCFSSPCSCSKIENTFSDIPTHFIQLLQL